MALITRVSRLFRADMHAVLDRIEEPDLLLRQAIREMEEELAGDEQRLATTLHEQAELAEKGVELERTLEEIGTQIDVCFESAQEELARSLIRRRLETERYVKHIGRKREALTKAAALLRGRLDENGTRLESMRQKAELLAGDRSAARHSDGWSAADCAVRDEDVEVAFLREKQRRARA